MKLKSLLIMIVAVLSSFIVAVGGLIGTSIVKNTNRLAEEGYILDNDGDAGEVSYYFADGTTYKRKSGNRISFNDEMGRKVTVDETKFVHYISGDVMSFRDGVLADMDELIDGVATYYDIGGLTTLEASGSGYAMQVMEQELSMDNILWKISDTDYIVLSDTLLMNLSGMSTSDTADYVQIRYVDNGVVSLYNQSMSVKTAANGSTIRLANGVVIDLGKRSVEVNDEVRMTMDQMLINGEENVPVDPNNQVDLAASIRQTVQSLMPTFEVIDGATGEIGTTGAGGLAGGAGTNGTNGTNGVNGTNGTNGSDGGHGNQGSLGAEGEAGYDGANASTYNPALAGTSVSKEPKNFPTAAVDIKNTYANGVSFVVNVVDKDFCIGAGNVPGTSQKVRIKIIDAATGETVFMDSGDAGMPEFTLPATGAYNTYALKPGTAYLIRAIADIQYDEQTLMEYTLASKMFVTQDSSVKLEKIYAEPNALALGLDVMDYSTATAATITISGPNLETRTIELNSDDLSAIQQNGWENFGRAEDLKLSGLTRDSEYNVRLDVTYAGSDTAHTTVQTFKTLKNTPKWEEVKGVASNVDSALHVSIGGVVENNIENGIQGYYFELKDSQGKVVATKTSSTPNATFSMLAGEVNAYEEYRADCYILFNDNEKLVQVEAGTTGIMSLNGLEFPSLIFVEDENGITWERIKGVLSITDKDSMIKEGSIHIVYRSSLDPAKTYEFSNQQFDENTKTYTIPVEMNHLWSATSYTFYVYADMKDPTNDGITHQNELLDTIVINTRVTPPMTAAMYEVQSETFENTQTFALNLSKPVGANYDYTDSYMQLAANTLSNLQLSIYEEDIVGQKKLISGSNRTLRYVYDSEKPEYASTIGKALYTTEGILNKESYQASNWASKDNALINNNTGVLYDVKDTDGALIALKEFQDLNLQEGKRYYFCLSKAMDYTYVDDELDAEIRDSKNQFLLIQDESEPKDAVFFPFTINPDYPRIEFPNDGINVTYMENKFAAGTIKEDKNLSGDAVLGVQLQPKSLEIQDNSRKYIKSITYYVEDVVTGQSRQLATVDTSGQPVINPSTFYFKDIADADGELSFDRGHVYRFYYTAQIDLGTGEGPKTWPGIKNELGEDNAYIEKIYSGKHYFPKDQVTVHTYPGLWDWNSEQNQYVFKLHTVVSDYEKVLEQNAEGKAEFRATAPEYETVTALMLSNTQNNNNVRVYSNELEYPGLHANTQYTFELTENLYVYTDAQREAFETDHPVDAAEVLPQIAALIEQVCTYDLPEVKAAGTLQQLVKVKDVRIEYSQSLVIELEEYPEITTAEKLEMLLREIPYFNITITDSADTTNKRELKYRVPVMRKGYGSAIIEIPLAEFDDMFSTTAATKKFAVSVDEYFDTNILGFDQPPKQDYVLALRSYTTNGMDKYHYYRTGSGWASAEPIMSSSFGMTFSDSGTGATLTVSNASAGSLNLPLKYDKNGLTWNNAWMVPSLLEGKNIYRSPSQGDGHEHEYESIVPSISVRDRATGADTIVPSLFSAEIDARIIGVRNGGTVKFDFYKKNSNGEVESIGYVTRPITAGGDTDVNIQDLAAELHHSLDIDTEYYFTASFSGKGIDYKPMLDVDRNADNVQYTFKTLSGVHFNQDPATRVPASVNYGSRYTDKQLNFTVVPDVVSTGYTTYYKLEKKVGNAYVPVTVGTPVTVKKNDGTENSYYNLVAYENVLSENGTTFTMDMWNVGGDNLELGTQYRVSYMAVSKADKMNLTSNANSDDGMFYQEEFTIDALDTNEVRGYLNVVAGILEGTDGNSNKPTLAATGHILDNKNIVRPIWNTDTKETGKDSAYMLALFERQNGQSKLVDWVVAENPITINTVFGNSDTAKDYELKFNTDYTVGIYAMVDGTNSNDLTDILDIINDTPDFNAPNLACVYTHDVRTVADIGIAIGSVSYKLNANNKLVVTFTDSSGIDNEHIGKYEYSISSSDVSYKDNGSDIPVDATTFQPGTNPRTIELTLDNVPITRAGQNGGYYQIRILFYDTEGNPYQQALISSTVKF